MDPGRKKNFNDWYMKEDLPLWIGACFGFLNLPVDVPN